MTASVRISLKAAKALLELVDGGPGIYGVPHEHAEQDLRSAISRAERASARRRKLAKPKAEKRASKREETGAIYDAVEARAEGCCEGCGGPFVPGNPQQMDHQWGRGKAQQTVFNCWLLHTSCHARKGRSEAGRPYWLQLFRNHCLRHGYTEEAAKVTRELGWAESKARAAP